MEGNICFLIQICKIHLAYTTVREAAMQWEGNFEYAFITESLSQSRSS